MYELGDFCDGSELMNHGVIERKQECVGEKSE